METKIKRYGKLIGKLPSLHSTFAPSSLLTILQHICFLPSLVSLSLKNLSLTYTSSFLPRTRLIMVSVSIVVRGYTHFFEKYLRNEAKPTSKTPLFLFSNTFWDHNTLFRLFQDPRVLPLPHRRVQLSTLSPRYLHLQTHLPPPLHTPIIHLSKQIPTGPRLLSVPGCRSFTRHCRPHSVCICVR